MQRFLVFIFIGIFFGGIGFFAFNFVNKQKITDEPFIYDPNNYFSSVVNEQKNTNPVDESQNDLKLDTKDKTDLKSSEPQIQVPPQKTLQNDYHIFQTFNNCGPAALSMAFSYFDLNVSQQDLGMQLRPFQNAKGDNDDKSTTLEELAQKAEDYGFLAYHRPSGDFDKIAKFIANDIPVVARTWLKPNDDIGHYRIIKGYDLNNSTIIQDDSLQGKNLVYSYAEFEEIWNKFGFEYLVIVPKDKQQIAETILEQDLNQDFAWKRSLEYWQKQVSQNPNNVNAVFNLSVAYYKNGKYKESVEQFELVENSINKRALWYQIEPILSYVELKNYDKVFEITDTILQNGNRAFSELYLIRGEIYKEQGNLDSAKKEFELAVFYNQNLQQAQNALEEINYLFID